MQVNLHDIKASDLMALLVASFGSGVMLTIGLAKWSLFGTWVGILIAAAIFGVLFAVDVVLRVLTRSTELESGQP